MTGSESLCRRFADCKAMKYRTRSEIIAQVLRTANSGATKTRIMYGAYLSYAQLKEYLEFLESKALIMREQGTELYRLTAKGLEFLEKFEEMNDIISLRPDDALNKGSQS
jgi:predicted transcriptional regulator